MNKLTDKFLLGGDKFKPEMRLSQAGFTYITCGPFTRNKDKTQKFKKTGNPKDICIKTD